MKQSFKRWAKALLTPLLVAVLSVTLISAGCSFSSAVSQLEKYAPIGLNAFSQVVAILLEAGVIKVGVASNLNDGVAKGTKVLADLQSAVNAYQASPSPDKLTAVTNALNAADASLAQFASDLGVSAQNKAVVAAQAGLLVITTTLASISAAMAPKASLSKVARVSKINAKTFKHQFNAVMLANGYPQHTI